MTVSTANRPPRIFVTVGSTKFVDLISHCLTHSFLSSLPPETSLTIQYGKSDLASILTREDNALASSSASTSSGVKQDVGVSSAVRIDAGSEMVPEVGLRASKQHGVSWKGSQLKGLDPGLTGAIDGWQIVGDGSEEENDDEEEGDDEDEGEAAAVATGGSRPAAGRARRPKRSPGAHFITLPSSLKFRTTSSNPINIELIDFVPDLRPHLSASDIVISHAGSGTILETLRLPAPTPRLIVVPNTTLMDNHQVELADAIAKGGWARAARVDHGGEEALESVLREVLRSRSVGGAEPTPFPPAKPERFRQLVDEAMGF